MIDFFTAEVAMFDIQDITPESVIWNRLAV